ncbi:MAG: SRPBCC domain-containing protein [Phenylobacterium sp.]|uniref:SRPBCC domain-containing protein n=1 Tax=Phenylobacterium sp. TaxID=1871053 RepID=UPI002734E6AF|nr:SRPBCC domain-containing protein [Phenylobacterium sp.]MDP3748716.1 SRPBCC domain-containing protein [Phenylobacterium sp.]
MHSIRTEALIPASPDRVYAVLADFARYPEWNPLNLAAHGEARLGARVPMVFRDLPGKPGAVIRQTVRIVAAEPGRELAWAGQAPLIFKGRHGFLLTSEGAGTRLVHTEVLSGLLPATWSAERIARDFTPAYEAVNTALAARVASLG